MLYMMDVDGTLIKSFYDGTRRALPYDNVELLPSRKEQIRRLVRNDPHSSFAVITNQGGVAFGYNTLDEVEHKLAVLVYMFDFFYSRPFSVHYCCTHPEAPEQLNGEPNPWRKEDPRRKPGCGMLDEAMMAHRIVERTNAIYIGDLPSDQSAAAAAGVAYMEAEAFFAKWE